MLLFTAVLFITALFTPNIFKEANDIERVFSDQIITLLTTAEQKFRKYIQLVTSALDLTPAQMMILTQLYEFGEQRIGDLASRCCMVESNASATCSRLEKAGLVLRTRQPEDQRTVKVGLTIEAAKRMSAVMRSISLCKSAVMDQMSDDEMRLVADSVNLFIRCLDGIDYAVLAESLRKISSENTIGE